MSTLAGSGQIGYADGTGVNAVFASPAGVCVDTLGVLYVADANRIRQINVEG